MKKAAVIGNPISHSLSPTLHNSWCQKNGVEATYEAIQLAPEGLDAFLDRIRTGEFVGASVTIPFKENIFEKMDALGGLAKATGAVNTIVGSPDGKLLGRNTDPEGFFENLKRAAPEFDPVKTTALVLGAGGAARAVVSALLRAGVSGVTVAGRSEKKVASFLDFFSNPTLGGAPWPDINKLAAKSTLIINATPLGLSGFGDIAIDLRRAQKKTLVYDLLYTSHETALVKAAKTEGLKTLDGLGMLIFQAVPAFEAWFGIRPVVDADTYGMLRDHLNHKDR